MEELIIKGTTNTPEITFKKEIGTICIHGRSIPEHPLSYYENLSNWIGSYLNSSPKKIHVDIYLDYLNTPSIHNLMNILKKIETYKNANECNVKIIWRYDEDDEDMEVLAEGFALKINIPIEMVEVPEEE